jgi:6-phosphogluconate dehydrogenase
MPHDIAMIGLGVMGRNLLLNMADRGFAVAGYDQDAARVEALLKEGAGLRVAGAANLKELADGLKKPRAVMMLVPAGKTVDAVIRDLLPLLEPGDTIIDGGNSHWKDTDLRAQAVGERGVQYLGVGISGGEEGARRGPAMMPGGPREAYERVRPIFEACAARVGDDPCVAYIGPGSSGHFVKMVHNGIEYALMQLIAETYDILRRGLKCDNARIHRAFQKWNEGPLHSFLIEITADIFGKMDPKTGKPLVEQVLDKAKQKGTGKWTSQDAMDLGMPVPTIDAAVAMRQLSAFKSERVQADRLIEGPELEFEGDHDAFIDLVGQALLAASFITFAQGMDMLSHASDEYGFQLQLTDVTRIWRGGCIIRSTLLARFHEAYVARHDLPNLLLDPVIARDVLACIPAYREVLAMAVRHGVPAACYGAALAYFDAYRSDWMPANLIQAQRDCFGAHTYERVDERGTFHTEWRED